MHQGRSSNVSSEGYGKRRGNPHLQSGVTVLSVGYTMKGMSTFKARVRNGRITLDEPTNLPEGTVVELSPRDPYEGLDDGSPFDHLSPEEKAKLDASIERGIAQAEACLGRPVEEFLKEL